MSVTQARLPLEAATQAQGDNGSTEMSTYTARPTQLALSDVAADESRPVRVTATRLDPTMHGSDCGCVTHNGPHAEHMDRLMAEIARERLCAALARAEQTRDIWALHLAYAGFAQSEIARLDIKAHELQHASQA